MSRLTSHFKGGQQNLPTIADFERLSPRVMTVLGKNPGPFALTGTNTYLIGEGPKKILLDTGEGNPEYIPNLERAMASCGCTGISKIIITHWHFDHLGGLPSVQQRFGPHIPVVSKHI
jgi:glyoxylase-like metal-dependent hydrolase (beta-lactamase superfamily II)